jgi:ABC-type nitrate/sulfonate/bicarbonate transport system permease component
VPAPAEGGPPTYAAALLALGNASLITFERVLSGIVFGTLGGIGLGLLVATSDTSTSENEVRLQNCSIPLEALRRL